MNFSEAPWKPASRNVLKDFWDFPVGKHVIVRTGISPRLEKSGYIEEEKGIVEQTVTKDDPTAVVVRLASGNAIRISASALRQNERIKENQRE